MRVELSLEDLFKGTVNVAAMMSFEKQVFC